MHENNIYIIIRDYLSLELIWALSLSDLISSIFELILILLFVGWIGLEMSLARPLKLNNIEITLSLSQNIPNHEDKRGLVKIHASWSVLDMNLIERSFLATMSRTKWKSISTCLVLTWKTKFEDRYVAPILSHHNVGADKIGVQFQCIKMSTTTIQ
jgi:hypothetical protein